MKIIYSNTKENYFIFYLSQIFFKKPVYMNDIYNFAEIFKIDKNEIRGLDITGFEKKIFLKGKVLKTIKNIIFYMIFIEK